MIIKPFKTTIGKTFYVATEKSGNIYISLLGRTRIEAIEKVLKELFKAF